MGNYSEVKVLSAIGGYVIVPVNSGLSSITSKQERYVVKSSTEVGKKVKELLGGSE